MEILPMTPPPSSSSSSTGNKRGGQATSVLRRSSVVLSRRLSMSQIGKEDMLPPTPFSPPLNNSYTNGNLSGSGSGSGSGAPKRRFSTNPLTQSAPLFSLPSSMYRRNSLAVVRRTKHVNDATSNINVEGFPLPRPLLSSGSINIRAPVVVPPSPLEPIQAEEDSENFDSVSVCSDITEITEIEDGDIDPSDWFLEEEMDDEPVFTILEKDELTNLQRGLINSVATQLDVKPADAALVMQHFNWDTEKLLREYFDDPDFHKRESGIATDCSTPPFSSPSPSLSPIISHQPTSSSSSPSSTPTTSSPNNFQSALGETVLACPVCMEEKDTKEFCALWCSHMYCLECWREYLHQKTSSSGPEIVNVNCMYPHCIAKLNFEDFEKLADPYDYKRYCYFYLKHFTESDPRMVICPNPTCGNAAKYHGTGRPSDVVECHCGTRFCFSCGHEKHNPVTCEQLNIWLGQLQDDGESIAVIKATSKPCWHCGVATTRVSGCNHMICRKEMGGCGGEWCWMCRGDWATHGAHTGGFYSCNKYETSAAKEEDEEARKYLEPEESKHRLLHYYNRYFNHDVLMKNVQKMLHDGDVEAKMVAYTDITGHSPDFYLEAAELLVECRRVLKYTYVYGYYLNDSPGKVLFEYQQASAEGITERLSEMFHSPVEDVAAQPLDFVNYIRVTKKYITNLVRSVEEEGFVKDSLVDMSMVSDRPA